MKRKIMQAMNEREASRTLQGFVQIDDAYLGGERNGGKPGRGSENKQPFLIAVQTDPTFAAVHVAVIEPVRSVDDASLKDWIARRLAPECEVYTDGLACFRRLEAAYRFNRRFRLHEMVPRLATAMVRCKPCSEPVLPASNFHG